MTRKIDSAQTVNRRGTPASWSRSILSMALALAAVAVHADWTSLGTLNVPRSYAYSFLAASPTGDLLAATVNNEAAPLLLPAVLIRNPASPAPEVKELCSASFEAQLGYGGIASDVLGSFYVSADTGDGSTSWVRKFNSDGTPDTSFANQGEYRPGRRCLGVDVLGDNLLLAVDWGTIQVIHTGTGLLVGTIADPGARSAFVRDIVVDPTNLRIFGVAAGGMVSWNGGTLANPAGYLFSQIMPAKGTPRSGEGISIDPVSRALLITPVPGNTLVSYIPGSAQATSSIVQTAGVDAHIADSVVSFDGDYLFLSDIRQRSIHVMKRNDATAGEPENLNLLQLAASTSAASPALTPVPSQAQAGGAAAPVQWYDSYNKVFDWARSNRKPVLLYFRKGDFSKCIDFEPIFETEQFRSLAAPFVCVYEDVGVDPLTAYKFGANRVPCVLLLTANGDILARYAYNIDSQQLFQAMAAVK